MKLLGAPGYFRDSAFNFTLPPEIETLDIKVMQELGDIRRCDGQFYLFLLT